MNGASFMLPGGVCRWIVSVLGAVIVGCAGASGATGSGQSTQPRVVQGPTATPTSRPASAATAAAEILNEPPSDLTDEPCDLPLELKKYGWPRTLEPASSEVVPLEPGSVTLAILPDTQYYASCRSPHLRAQSEWVVDQAQALNIRAVLQLGDLTEHNTPEEWEFVRDALAPAMAKLPAFLATGNHDHGDQGSANRRFTLFQKYFPTPAPRTAATLATTWHPGDLENAYYRIVLPKATLGVMVLEWSPRQEAVMWANHVLTRYSRDRVIFVTHAYLYNDNTRYDWAGKGPTQEWNPNTYGTSGLSTEQLDAQYSPRVTSDDAYDGERLWRELVSLHPGVFLTLNGHVLGDGTGQLSSRGSSGNVVHQVLVNYQMLEQGGLGFLRLLEISPRGDRLRMKTFSPSLGSWATANDQYFDLALDPPLW
jgi:hypothetical protein